VINFPGSPLISSESKFCLFYESNFLDTRNFKTKNRGSNGSAAVRNRDRVRGSSALSRRDGRMEARFNRSFKEQRRPSEKANLSTESRCSGGIFKGHFGKKTRDRITSLFFTLPLCLKFLPYTCQTH